ncbi:hypothetical protein ACHAWF_006749 [Thalassiosira exigua]
MDINARPDIAVTEVGTWTFHLRFGGFETLPTTLGVFVESPEFDCHGRQWQLRVYPYGSKASDYGDVVATLFSKVKFPRVDELIPMLALVGPGGYQKQFPQLHMNTSPYWDSWTTKLGRATVRTSFVQEGSLVVQVHLGKNEQADEYAPSSPFIPANPFGHVILKQFMNEQSADVLFEVGNKKASDDGRKRVKTIPTTFYAHRFVLEHCAPLLFDTCTSSGENIRTPIKIDNVDSDIFHHLLYYVYGGKIDIDDIEENAKAIISAADRFGIVNLKLEAEASLVASTEITVDNVMELLMYANDKNCALLKEAAMDYLANSESALDTVSFSDVPGHLMKDLLASVHVNNDVRVNTLRMKLHEKGSDIDGSRETMMALLEENS